MTVAIATGYRNDSLIDFGGDMLHLYARTCSDACKMLVAGVDPLRPLMARLLWALLPHAVTDDHTLTND